MQLVFYGLFQKKIVNCNKTILVFICRCPIVDIVDPVCDPANEVKAKSDEFCGLIKSTAGPFSACASGDPGMANAFFDNCVYDTCANTIKESSCAGIEAFIANCASKGYRPATTWRKDTGCGKDNN